MTPLTKLVRKPMLSICIPTYNRSATLTRNLSKLINTITDDYEIIISDNASTDDTKLLLNKFDSKKIKYFVNLENVGIVRNVFYALNRAQGYYRLLLSDEDFVDIDKLVKFLGGLKQQKYSAVLLSVEKLNGIKYVSYKNREFKSAFSKHFFVWLKSFYLSGFIFTISDQELVRLTNEYLNNPLYANDVYPHIYLLSEVMTMGNLLTTNEIFIYQGEKDINLIYEKNYSKFFFSESRYDQFVVQLTLLQKKYELNSLSKYIISVRIFKRLLIGLHNVNLMLDKEYFNYYSSLKNFKLNEIDDKVIIGKAIKSIATFFGFNTFLHLVNSVILKTILIIFKVKVALIKFKGR